MTRAASRFLPQARTFVTACVLLIAAVGVAAGTFVLLPARLKSRVLARAVDVADRAMRRTHFTAEYQPVYARLHQLALTGMGSGFDGVAASGEAHAILEYRRRLLPLGQDRLVFVDGGAYEGEYTDALLAAFAGAGRPIEVHAFEPASAAFGRLASRFAGDARIHANRSALGERAGLLPLRIQASEKMNTLVASASAEAIRTESVEVATLDAYCEARGIARIDILKLDIEGFELNALRGAQRLLRAGDVRIVQFEFGAFSLENHVTFAEIAAWLGAEYEIHRIVGDGLIPVAGRDSEETAGELRRQNILGGNYAAFSKDVR